MAVKNKIFLPTLISSVTYQPVRTLPHIYFYNGLKDCEDYYIQHYPSGSTAFVETSVQNQFPYLDYYDGLTPTTASNSLLFFNESTPYGDVPTSSLYTEYWDKYVSLLYNPRTRLINASAIIPLADYFEMELNDIVQWRGNYYHLRAINDYNLKDGTCKLQLLGPIIRDAAPTDTFDCTFNFSSSLEGSLPVPTTTTIAPTTSTTIAPTTTTTAPPCFGRRYCNNVSEGYFPIPAIRWTDCNGSSQSANIPYTGFEDICAREVTYVAPGITQCAPAPTYCGNTTTTTIGPTTTLAPTTTIAPTTTTTIPPNAFVGSGYGNTVNGACSDASINNRTLYSECSSINVGCNIYTTIGGTPLTGYDFVFIDGAVWNINSSTGVITNFSSIQC